MEEGNVNEYFGRVTQGPIKEMAPIPKEAATEDE